MIRLNQLATLPTSLDLAGASANNDLTLPISLTDISSQRLIEQEKNVSISGAVDLKNQLVTRLHPFLNQVIDPQQILITSGAQQAFYLIAQGLLGYGDAIAVEAPSYFYQLSLFQEAGIRVFGIPLLETGELDRTTLRQIYYKHQLRFLLVNPTGQNPTGQTMPFKFRQALVQYCRQLKLPIVEDDPIQIASAITANQIVPLKALDPDNVILIGSLSSLLGNSARIGWLIAPRAIVDRLAEIRQHMDAGISIFPQIVASQFLSQSDLKMQIQQQRAKLTQRRDLLIRALAPFVQQQALTYTVPAYGNSLWVQLHIDHPLVPSDYNAFLAQQLLVRPDFLFGSHQNRIRISFINFKEAQIADLQRRLRLVLDKLTGK
jgi:DNA-binding transcriptional MocR family regulator